MKTIMDAVNELKGDLENSHTFKGSDKYIFWSRRMLHYVCDSGEPTTCDNYQFICTVDKFNILIAQLETNFGRSVTRKEWLINKENEMKYTPKVGEKCIAVYATGCCIVTVAHINHTQLACIDGNDDYLIQYTDSSTEYFKPLPTEEEKTITDLIKVLSDSYTDTTDIVKNDVNFEHYAKALIKDDYHNQPKVKPLSYGTFYKESLKHKDYSEDYKWLVDNNHIVSE